MDDITVYLPDGKRVIIEEPADSSYRAIYDFTAELQDRKWYGWKTLVRHGIQDVDITELESEVDGIICALLADYDRQQKRKQTVANANVRLKALFNGKVRDVKCPVEEDEANGAG